MTISASETTAPSCLVSESAPLRRARADAMAQLEGRPLLRVTPADLNQSSRTFSEWEGPIGLTHVTHRAKELGAVLFIDDADPLARRRASASSHRTLAERLAAFVERQGVPVIYGFKRRPATISSDVIHEIDTDATR